MKEGGRGGGGGGGIYRYRLKRGDTHDLQV